MNQEDNEIELLFQDFVEFCSKSQTYEAEELREMFTKISKFEKDRIIKIVEGMKKQDLDLSPGFITTAEYRLGEIRGSNQACEAILEELNKPDENS